MVKMRQKNINFYYTHQNGSCVLMRVYSKLNVNVYRGFSSFESIYSGALMTVDSWNRNAHHILTIFE